MCPRPFAHLAVVVQIDDLHLGVSGRFACCILNVARIFAVGDLCKRIVCRKHLHAFPCTEYAAHDGGFICARVNISVMRQHAVIPGACARCRQLGQCVRRGNAAMRHQLTAFKIKPKDRVARPIVGFRHFDRADLAQANAVAVTRMADDVVCPGCILQQPVFPQFAVFEKAVGLAACRVNVQVGIRNVCCLLKGHIRRTVCPVCKHRAGKGYIDAAEVGA